MPGPAARMGDSTAHGGTIVLGMPMVLIGGMPAARLTDMHVCPMVTPAPAPVPHVGGPIVGPGVPTVLIGGMPAATIGDMCVCVGPPDSIVMGCTTVILGMAGAGAGSAGVASAGAGAGAAASAAAALFDNTEPTTLEEHWVEFEFVDKAGKPVSGVSYRLKDTSSRETQGVLRVDGRVRRDALEKSGQCEVTLYSVYAAKWSKSSAELGEKVKLTAKVEGFEAGTEAVFTVYRRELMGADVEVDEIRADTKSDSVEAEWAYQLGEDENAAVVPDENTEGAGRTAGYVGPQYFFEVVIGPCHARSGLLGYADFLEIEVKDERGDPLANAAYVLHVSDGTVRQGKLDGSGKMREEGLSAGHHDLRFPELPDVEPKP